MLARKSLLRPLYPNVRNFIIGALHARDSTVNGASAIVSAHKSQISFNDHMQKAPNIRQFFMSTVQAAVIPQQSIDESCDIDWDNLGFQDRPTDHMFVMKCNIDGEWQEGEVKPYGLLELSPAAGVLNYGQGVFEGMKVYRTEDGRLLLFRPEENAKRMIHGADRMCMPAPSIGAFVDAVKQTVLANKRWIPPTGKGALYMRPLLIGSGPVLGLARAPEYTFLVYAAPVGNYFKEGPNPIHLKIESLYPRAVYGGTGGIKTPCNYGPVLKAQLAAKKAGFADVLYLDAVEKKHVEEVSSCNIFVVKNNVISTPGTRGSILPGITRKSVIELASSMGYKVEERNISVGDLLGADEVFCTGTAVVVCPVGSITHQDARIEYSKFGPESISSVLRNALTGIQTGRVADRQGWTVEVN